MTLRLMFFLMFCTVVIGIGLLALFNAMGLGAGFRFGTILVTGCVVWYIFKFFELRGGN